MKLKLHAEVLLAIQEPLLESKLTFMAEHGLVSLTNRPEDGAWRAAWTVFALDHCQSTGYANSPEIAVNNVLTQARASLLDKEKWPL